MESSSPDLDLLCILDDDDFVSTDGEALAMGAALFSFAGAIVVSRECVRESQGEILSF